MIMLEAFKELTRWQFCKKNKKKLLVTELFQLALAAC